MCNSDDLIPCEYDLTTVQVLDSDFTDTMTDNGDNTYSYEYTVDRPGEITIQVFSYVPEGVYSEWFDNYYWVPPYNFTEIRTNMTENFGFSSVNGLSKDKVTAKFYFGIKPPVDETYTFGGLGDNIFRVSLEGTQIISANHQLVKSDPVALKADTFYDMYCEFEEGSGNAKYKLQWEYPGQASQTIPSQNFFSLESDETNTQASTN